MTNFCRLCSKRLGQILYQTNGKHLYWRYSFVFQLSSSQIDFLAVETLFTVFARLLPSIDSGDSGRAKRSKFVQAVFLQPSSKCGPELVQVLEEVSRSAWEDTVVVLMDVLARNYITLCVDHSSVCSVAELIFAAAHSLLTLTRYVCVVLYSLSLRRLRGYTSITLAFLGISLTM